MQLACRCLVAFFLSMLSLSSLAQTPAQQLQALLASTHTLQASFKQTTVSETGELMAIASGVVKVVRPGQFYWQVNQPGKQIIVINHQQLWLYDVDLEQVTIKKLDPSVMALNPVSLLSGDLDKLLQHNSVKSLPGGIKLTPESPESAIKWVKLLFNGKKLTGLQFANQLSQQTTIHFSELKINQPIPPQTFNIHIPKGTDIVSQ